MRHLYKYWVYEECKSMLMTISYCCSILTDFNASRLINIIQSQSGLKNHTPISSIYPNGEYYSVLTKRYRK